MDNFNVEHNTGGHEYHVVFRHDTDAHLDPDWLCPRCKWVNMNIRQKCRNCGMDIDEAYPGEVTVVEWSFLEISENING